MNRVTTNTILYFNLFIIICRFDVWIRLAVGLQATVGYCCRQGIHCCVCLQPLMNKDIKVKDNKQKPNKARPAQTEADSELQPKITTSRPACSNTFVGRSACLSDTFKFRNNNTL